MKRSAWFYDRTVGLVMYFTRAKFCPLTAFHSRNNKKKNNFFNFFGD